ncbi:unnamed protein product [Brassicogethes aeneus]|uniref:Uncharacterized protein n=1 Tax=Brassicogethes aeneus TaxID=1431903 RepID=A0A9P0BGR8_BRAAE|nr:unnamed protein product [Brassicogethes aeneus]
MCRTRFQSKYRLHDEDAERARRYREKVKENPEKHQVYLRKGRERAKKSRKPIAELSTRKQRFRRKRWRLDQLKCRENKKIHRGQFEFLEEITPPGTPDPIDVNEKLKGARNPYKSRLLEEQLKKSKKAVEKYRKRYHRYKNLDTKNKKSAKQNTDPPNPFTKAMNDTQGYEVPDTVVKTLSSHLLTFCRHRPCWVVRQKLSDRDSCLCKKHSNMQYKLDTLFREQLCIEKDIEKLCIFVTCDTKSNECMNNICLKCRDKPVVENIEFAKKILEWKFWKLEKEEKFKAGKTFTISKTKLVNEKGKLMELCLNFNKEFRTVFCSHVYKKNHQTQQRQKCISELAFDEAQAENYICKMASEIQAMHFGSSHNQASLQTVVFYYENQPSESICTISCTRHDPAAIWAYAFNFTKL